MNRLHLALSMSAGWLPQPLLVLAGCLALAIAAVMLGAPAVDDVGSWRWTVARLA